MHGLALTIALVLCLAPTSLGQGKKGGGGGGGAPPADPAIAYMKTGNNGYDLMVMNADGSNAKSIYHGSMYLFGGLSFSPSGPSIAFMSAIGGVKIKVIDLRVQNGTPVGENLRTVLDVPEGNVAWAQWSPRDDEIAFLYHGPAQPRFPQGPGIYTVPPAGGAPTLAFAYPPNLYAGYFDYSPDGSKFVICTSSNTIYTANRWGGEYQILGTFPEFDTTFSPKWSRGGDRIVFSAHGSAGNYQLLVMDAAPGAQPQLVATGVRFPTWSPDDSEIALTTASTSSRVVVLNLATGQIRTISSTRSDHCPDWRRF